MNFHDAAKKKVKSAFITRLLRIESPTFKGSVNKAGARTERRERRCGVSVSVALHVSSADSESGTRFSFLFMRSTCEPGRQARSERARCQPIRNHSGSVRPAGLMNAGRRRRLPNHERRRGPGSRRGAWWPTNLWDYDPVEQDGM